MKITILTLFPTMYDGFLNTSIIKRIIDKGIAEIKVVDIRDYSLDKHRHVDDTPYGGGAGMLMKVDVVDRALTDNASANAHVILTSPKGKKLKQEDLIRLSKLDDIVIICGHYEGLDARIEDHCNELISIGDYILTGGELASMVISDGILRLLDDSISEESLKEESFDNNLLEYDQYTRPYDYKGNKVPDVLVNGNHKDIEHYKLKSSLKQTIIHRPDLLKNRSFTAEEIKILEEIKQDLANNSHK